mmetsp:Transcript_25697/g.56294  ORF Transcript_25697/g.56294 Transcript_25697/m.56294 type:complete len:341 (-) Transcript_25697:365-1387(-)
MTGAAHSAMRLRKDFLSLPSPPLSCPPSPSLLPDVAELPGAAAELLLSFCCCCFIGDISWSFAFNGFVSPLLNMKMESSSVASVTLLAALRPFLCCVVKPAPLTSIPASDPPSAAEKTNASPPTPPVCGCCGFGADTWPFLPRNDFHSSPRCDLLRLALEPAPGHSTAEDASLLLSVAPTSAAVSCVSCALLGVETPRDLISRVLETRLFDLESISSIHCLALEETDCTDAASMPSPWRVDLVETELSSALRSAETAPAPAAATAAAATAAPATGTAPGGSRNKTPSLPSVSCGGTMSEAVTSRSMSLSFTSIPLGAGRDGVPKGDSSVNSGAKFVSSMK